jgi:hypothetical protein
MAETTAAIQGTTDATTEILGGEDPEALRIDRLDPVQRDGDVGQQHDRVVVTLLDRDPTHRVALIFARLGEQGGLAVAGWGDDTDQWHRLGVEEVDQGRPGHDPRRIGGDRSLDSTRSKERVGCDRRPASTAGIGPCPRLTNPACPTPCPTGITHEG